MSTGIFRIVRDVRGRFGGRFGVDGRDAPFGGVFSEKFSGPFWGNRIRRIRPQNRLNSGYIAVFATDIVAKVGPK
jgi:hypothetical protein